MSGRALLLLDQPALRRMNAYARSHRLVIRIDDVSHEVIKLDGFTASVTLACAPRLAVLVDVDTLVHEYGDIDIDCMTCLVKRGWVT